MDFVCSLAETELCGIQICQRRQHNGFICNISREDYVFVFMEEKAIRERKKYALISTNCTLKMWCTHRDMRGMGYGECCRIITSYDLHIPFSMLLMYICACMKRATEMYCNKNTVWILHIYADCRWCLFFFASFISFLFYHIEGQSEKETARVIVDLFFQFYKETETELNFDIIIIIQQSNNSKKIYAHLQNQKFKDSLLCSH